ncbi:MAG: 4-hydroxy-2-oxovalerate aldolase [Acidobacteriota bacterium]
MHPRPVLFECTLRDASYVVNFQFTAEHTRVIARALEDAGFDHIEIGHGLGLGASKPSIGIAAETDEAYLEAAASTLTRARWGTFFIPGIGESRHLDMAVGFGMDFVRVGANITEFRSARPHVEHAKALGLTVSVNLMKTYAVDTAALAAIVREIGTWQPDNIYVVDSAGCMLPGDVRQCIRAILDETGADAGMHAHHNLQLAVSNSLVALEEGARFVDTTLRGIGRSAGNAQTEVVIALLQQRGLMRSLDLMRVMAVSEAVFVPLVQTLAGQVPGANMEEAHRGSSPLELVLGLSKCHSSFLPMITAVAKEHTVNLLALVMAVSARDCVHPTIELCHEEARLLARESPVPGVHHTMGRQP